MTSTIKNAMLGFMGAVVCVIGIRCTHSWMTLPRIEGSWTLSWDESIEPETLQILGSAESGDLYHLRFDRTCSTGVPMTIWIDAKLSDWKLILSRPYDCCDTRFTSLSIYDDSLGLLLFPDSDSPAQSESGPLLPYYMRVES